MAARQQYKILVVEDDPTYRTLVLSTLRKAGMHCSFCVDGDHALEKLSQETFDAMVVDYLLPGPNAIEIVRWARQKDIRIPALIITNYPSDELNISNQDLGDTRILPKLAFHPSSMPKIVLDLLHPEPPAA
jgi:DNA-binding response OmpR family regulator